MTHKRRRRTPRYTWVCAKASLIDCDMCEGRFDPRGEHYDVIATRMPLSPWLWICDSCGTNNSVEEIADHFDLSHRHVYQELGFEYPLTEDHAGGLS